MSKELTEALTAIAQDRELVCPSCWSRLAKDGDPVLPVATAGRCACCGAVGDLAGITRVTRH